MIRKICFGNRKSYLFLVLAITFLGLSETQLFADGKKASDIDNIQVKNTYLKASLGTIKNLWRSHPGLCVGMMAGLTCLGLYPEKLTEFADMIRHPENRPFVLTGSLSALALLYAKHEAVSNYFCGSGECEDDEYDINDDDDDLEEEGQNAFERMMQSTVRLYFPGEITTKFADVAGLETVKQDLQDIVHCLKNPEDFAKIGAKIPKGVLLSGAPGNGKTLIARALAGEVQCPFLYISGSEFAEALVGVGAKRMRNLFAIARQQAPCIMFIDEIDSIGHKRSGFSVGSMDATQTLNQFLAEMDGFEQYKDPVVIIAATNRIDVLDEALLRPGRFDRQIVVHSPYVLDRCKILEIHLKNVITGPDIDAYKIALGTTGFSGADLANLVNEAAILAVRERAPAITMAHIDQARDYVWLGRETKGMDISHEDQWTTAVHEAGHTLCVVYQTEATPLYKVTIVPRSNALGITWSQSTKETYSKTEAQMRAAIVVKLGGSVAEELIFGHRDAGIETDIESARAIAESMVMRYGMSEAFKDISFHEYKNTGQGLPDEIATKLHQEVVKIIHECRSEAKTILLKNKQKLLQLAERLMADGTLMAEDVYRMCGVKQPEILKPLSS